MTLISQVVDVSGNPDFDRVRMALAFIDSVHSVTDIPTIPVRFVPNLSVRGSLRLRDGRPTEIVLQRGLGDCELTVIHEIGHLLDFSGIGSGTFFATGFDRLTIAVQDALINWGSAVNASRVFQYLTEVSERGSFEISIGGMYTDFLRLHPKQLALIAYLRSTEELFARGYVQYIATKSSDDALRDAIRRDRDSEGASVYPAYWDDDDFVPIATAMDGLFATLGWL